MQYIKGAQLEWSAKGSVIQKQNIDKTFFRTHIWIEAIDRGLVTKHAPHHFWADDFRLNCKQNDSINQSN